ncbi:hypothetical protein W822_01610 [Advenella kashmirensis W13003]|uniref:Uncharacterized protein n=1 Tax=Advenella kashmirensis W13003 TaxID=1424334 RepID=V8QZB6_9BURK|nr:hypothetical protein [Advenella kashmirensis]ETF04655.1 hypothetical protein W822_01610 [Advenella kashmirensis W13003]
MNKKFEPQCVEFVSSTPEALTALVQKDSAKWRSIIDDAGIEIE